MTLPGLSGGVTSEQPCVPAAVPALPDAAAWHRLALIYHELRDGLLALVARADLSARLKAELALRAEAARQASEHGRRRAAALEVDSARGRGRP